MASQMKNKVAKHDVNSPGSADEQEEPPVPAEDDDICELEHLRKLFIGGLAPYTTEDGLKEFYGKWGKVVDVVVMRDPTTKRSRGFGFITYTKSTMVDKAQENRPHVIDGKTVEAKRALPRPERESREVSISVKKLFVGGLKDNHDEECLQEYFSQFGNVVSVKILTDKTTGKRRGFAFIEFDDYDAVDKAILQKTHSIKYVVVDVKKSVYQEQQKQRQNGNGLADGGGGGGPNQQNQSKPPMQMGGPPPSNYRPPPPPQGMPPYQQPPPMHAGPPPPPQAYGYWGPPPPAMIAPQYGGYQQQPPPPQMTNWNWNAPNGWNAGPPPPPGGPPPSWQPPNQWGCPPPGPPPPNAPGLPQMPPQAGGWNTAAPVPSVPTSVPGMPNNVPPPPQQQQQQPQQAPPNYGYQQNYAGGPVKHNNMNANRMNPYAVPPNYGHNNQPPAPGYGSYSAPPTNVKPPGGPQPPGTNGPGPVPKPITNGSAGQSAGVAVGNNKFRR